MDKAEALRRLRARENGLRQLGIAGLSMFRAIARGVGSEAFAAIRPGLPFERVRGLGNVLRHACDTVEERQIYNLVRVESAKLRAACVTALGGDLG